jgi:hypothetical protein
MIVLYDFRIKFAGLDVILQVPEKSNRQNYHTVEKAQFQAERGAAAQDRDV